MRRLDGRPWAAWKHLTERKAHCVGRGKSWPVGLEEARSCKRIAWLEGAPDFIAFWQFAMAEGKTDSVAPVALLGAGGHRIEPAALPEFRGKHVRLFPHVDGAGREAAKSWARQLRDAGAQVRRVYSRERSRARPTA